MGIFDGRVEIITDDLLAHRADASRTKQYYEGAPLDWDIIAAREDIARDQQAELMEHLIQPAPWLRFICLHGEPGAGKSTMAWRSAAELHRQHRAIVLHVKDKEDPALWYRIIEFQRKLGRPIYVLADDIFRNPEVRHALAQMNSWLPITIMATSQTNEYYPGRLRGEVISLHLKAPSRQEKDLVLRHLGRDLSQLSPKELKRVEAANEFLVLMIELTAGKGFREIVRDSLDNLKTRNRAIYNAYEYLCFAFSSGVSIPASLLERLEPMGTYHDLPNREGAKGLVFHDDSHTKCLRPGHLSRAKIAAQIFEKDRSASVVLEELVNAAEPSDWLERRFAEHLLRSMAHKRMEVLRQTLPRIEHKVAALVEQSGIGDLAIWRLYFLALERFQDAERCVDIALSSEPIIASDCNIALGFYRERGRERDAHPVIERWIQNHPEWGEVGPSYLGLVDRYGTALDQDAAIKRTSDWLVAHQENDYLRQAYLGFVESRGSAIQVTETLKSTYEWLSDHPDDCAVRTAYLGLLEKKGSDDQIKKAITEAWAWLAAHQNDNYLRTAYLGLVERKGTTDQNEQAIKGIGAWLSEHQQDSNVRTAYLGFVERKGTPDQIDRMIEETGAWLIKHPHEANVLSKFISSLCAMGRNDDARGFAERAMAIHAKERNLLIQYLHLMGDRLEEQKVRDIYSNLRKQFPGDAVLSYNWARWLHEHKAMQEAEEAYNGIIAKHPKWFQPLYGCGRLLLDMKRYGDAQLQFNRVLKIHTGHAMARDGLGAALLALGRQARDRGDFKGARECYIAAEREYKNALYWAGIAEDSQAIFFTHLGWLYLELRWWDSAIVAFAQASHEAPEYYENYWGQGSAYMELGQWKEAAQYLKNALEKAPETLEPQLRKDIEGLLGKCEAREKGIETNS